MRAHRFLQNLRLLKQRLALLKLLCQNGNRENLTARSANGALEKVKRQKGTLALSL